MKVVATGDVYGPLFEEFTKDTGVTVEVLSMSSGEVLSKLRLEALGQRRLDVGPAPLTVYRERSKKVSYSLLLPPDMLEAVKDAADRDGSSASQFIRTAIARQLGRVK